MASPILSLQEVAELTSLLADNKALVVIPASSGNVDQGTMQLGVVDLETYGTYITAAVAARVTTLESTPAPSPFPAPITLTMSGPVTGSVSFDGSSNQSWTSNIANGALSMAMVSGLVTELDTFNSDIIALQTATTASNLLASIITVDGAGSGLDADKLDGLHASSFVQLINANSGNNAMVTLQSALASSPAPFLQVIGGRGDTNSSQAFSGSILLANNYTAGLAPTGQALGTLAFGAPTTINDLTTLRTSASVSAYADGTWTSTVTPTGIRIYVGNSPVTMGTPNVSYGQIKAVEINSLGQVQLANDLNLSGNIGLQNAAKLQFAGGAFLSSGPSGQTVTVTAATTISNILGLNKGDGTGIVAWDSNGNQSSSATISTSADMVAQTLSLSGTGTDTRITFNNAGIRRGLLAVNPTGPVGSWVVYTTDGGTAVGSLSIGSGGMTYSGGGFTLNCPTSTDILTVNTPGSSPAGSFIQVTSPGTAPGFVAQYGTTKRRDIQFNNTGIQLYVGTTTAGGSSQFTFGESGQFTAGGNITASGGSLFLVGDGSRAFTADSSKNLAFNFPVLYNNSGFSLGVNGNYWGFNTNGTFTTAGTVFASGEFQTTAANALRMVSGNYGVMWRQDGSTLNLLKTASADQYGSWDSTRPFALTLASNSIASDAAWTFSSTVNINAALTATSVTAGQFYNTWPIATGTIANGGSGGNNGFVLHANNNGGASATSAAALTFIRDGLFGCYFGLDTDNALKIGGWSYGNVSYRVVHEGLATVNLGTVNASAYGGAGVSQSASNSTLVQRTASGYINCNYINTTANDIGTGVPTDIAVQTGNDSYLRWQSPANFITALNIATKAANTFTGMQTFSGLLTPPTSANPGAFGMGNGDNASFTANNMAIYSWNGIGFGPSITGQAVANGTFSHYFDVRNGHIGLKGNLLATGLVTGSRIYAGWDSGAASSVSCSGWFRTTGATGLYCSDYAGGVYMTDTTYLRSYNNKAMAASDFVITSDEREKAGIRPLEFRGRLSPKSFTMKKEGTVDFGFIAQEVMVDYPEAVGYIEEADRYQLSYGKLTAILSHQVNAVEDEMAILKDTVARLTEQLSAKSALRRATEWLTQSARAWGQRMANLFKRQ